MFESGDFLYFANSSILSYTAYNAVYTFSIYVYTSISQYIPVWDIFVSMICNNSVYVGLAEYIPVCAWYIMVYTSILLYTVLYFLTIFILSYASVLLHLSDRNCPICMCQLSKDTEVNHANKSIGRLIH